MTRTKGAKDIRQRDRLATKQAAVEIEEQWRAGCPGSFEVFYSGIVIRGANGPEVFGTIIAEHQKVCFEDITPALHAVRDGVPIPVAPRFWWERTKKASKDADVALCLLWLVAFPVRPFLAQVGAGDKEQAAIVKSRIEDLLYYNPWLTEFVEIVKFEVRNKKNPLAKIVIESADVQGAHGAIPDLLVLNELTHVQKWEFVENMMANADGVPNGVVLVATNAGYLGTKPEVWRNNAIDSDLWQVRVFAHPAPWHSKAFLDDARRRELPARYRRLWRGIWATGKGDAFKPANIRRLFSYDIGPIDGPEPGWIYIGGLDLGVSHDHSGLVIIGIHIETGTIKLARFWAWEPEEETGEVDLIAVKDTCGTAMDMFGLVGLYYDPSQAKLMAQMLMTSVPMYEMSFTPKNCTAMAEATIQAVNNGILQLFDDETGRLRRDFGKFNIVEKPHGGAKLEATSDEYGHADVGTALIITLPIAVAMLDGGMIMVPDEITNADDDDTDLTAEEIEEMPAELRDIMDAEDEDNEDNRHGRAKDIWDF